MSLSNVILDHVNRPRNAGKLKNPTHVGVGGTPGEGPYVRLWLHIEAGTIVSASYECNGCPATIAASSVTAQVLTGRPLDVASSLTPEDLLTIIGQLPEGKEYCAELAITALHDALKNPIQGETP